MFAPRLIGFHKSPWCLFGRSLEFTLRGAEREKACAAIFPLENRCEKDAREVINVLLSGKGRYIPLMGICSDI